MRTIVYVSSAVVLFSHENLVTLLEKSRKNNTRLNITGMLFYKAGNFMQAIEGPDDTVYALYKIICNDPTHQNVIALIDETIDERSFADWSMGFATLPDKDMSSVDGYYDIFRKPFVEAELPIKASHARMLLSGFRQASR